MRLTPSFDTLVDLLQHRADIQPGDPAYTFLDSGEREGDRLTWLQLERRSRAIGAAIGERVPAGSRVLVMFPPGIDFIPAFFGCLYAGAIAVPTYPPSGGRSDGAIARLRGMLSDAGVALVVGPASVMACIGQLEPLVPELSRIACLAVDGVADDGADRWRHPSSRPDDIAFLQYTSGSTAVPRGVMVTHGNLLDNLEASAQLARHDESSISVSWLPVNHDMGLIEGVLQPAYTGFPAYLMAPTAFLQRPARWLQAISRLRATESGAPNFAYDLCVRRVTDSERRTLDLSAWRIAFSGSEPIRRTTLEAFQRTFGECGFRWNAFRPAYGLAESTLLVASSPRGDEPPCIRVDRDRLASGHAVVRRSPANRPEDRHDAAWLVSSGSAAGGSRVVIVDLQHGTECPPDRVGEIWVAGASVARGYWGRPKDTLDTFHAFLENGDGPFLRTGDLGFFHGQQLFVTGRIKDVLIVRGLKHYPPDLELTAERASPLVRPGCCAVFAVDSNGEERAAVVAEVDASRAGMAVDGEANQFQAAIASIRRGIAEVHSLAPCAVVLVAAGSLPKTTSGKLQRYACRHGFLTGRLQMVAEWSDADAPFAALQRVAS